METTKIIIADDHNIVRHAISQTIQMEKDLEIIAETDSGRSAVELSINKKPDIVIMDITMPDLNGVDATRQIISNVPTTKIIALSMHADKQFVEAMLDAGASGYVLKSSSFHELIKAIRALTSGINYFCKDTIQVLLGNTSNPIQNLETNLNNPLTQRENEVLQLVSKGYQNKAIARKLNIKRRTAETHHFNIKKKLNLNSTAELTKFAINAGLTSIDIGGDTSIH